MERTIRVTGKGKIAVKPDRIRLVLNLTEGKESYEQTLQASTQQVETLRDCFENLGFARTDLKTLSFDIDTCYENYQAEDKSWKQRFKGYECRHSLKIEFDADNAILGRVLYALAHAQVSPEFKILYTVKDVEAAKNQLLGKAVEDSREKAQALTKAAGVVLGEVLTIDYSWGEMELLAKPMNKMMEPCMVTNERTRMASYSMDIEPDDIEVSDTVTVVWGIL